MEKKYFRTTCTGLMSLTVLCFGMEIYAEAPPVLIKAWRGSGLMNGEFVSPRGIATDKAQSALYVSDTSDQLILKFNLSGKYLTQWGGLGSEQGQFNDPHNIALDKSGNIFVADTNNNRIQKFSNTGQFLGQWGSFGAGDGQFRRPHSITVNQNGEVYVSDIHTSRIQKFSNTGTFISQWGTWGSGEGQLKYPRGIATDSQNNVYIVDSSDNRRVLKFDGNGQFLRTIAYYDGLDGLLLATPRGIAIDALDNIYISEDKCPWSQICSGGRILKFSSSGKFLAQWGQKELIKPYAIDVDNKGSVYVADTNRATVYKYTYRKPTSPTNVSAAISSKNQIDLAWTDTSNVESSFHIQRCLTTACSFTTIATVPANTTNYSDTTRLAVGTSYTYRVIASNLSGNSVASNTTLVSYTVPAIPGSLVAKFLNENEKAAVALTWVDRAINEDGYILERCKDKSCTNFTVIASLPANSDSFTDTKITLNIIYRYRLKTFNAINNSGYSNVATVTTK